MTPKTALAVFAFIGSFAASANIHPPPCIDCVATVATPVPVVIVEPVYGLIDAGNPTLPKGVYKGSDFPFKVR